MGMGTEMGNGAFQKGKMGAPRPVMREVASTVLTPAAAARVLLLLLVLHR